jgi:hypothetical protein
LFEFHFLSKYFGGAGDRKVELYNFYRLLCRTPLESIKKMRSDWEKIGVE